eukprot:1139044-Pelagomonas_calceolata.AAC.5
MVNPELKGTLYGRGEVRNIAGKKTKHTERSNRESAIEKDANEMVTGIREAASKARANVRQAAQ